MRARRASRGVEADEGEPRKRRELETARKELVRIYERGEGTDCWRR